MLSPYTAKDEKINSAQTRYNMAKNCFDHAKALHVKAESVVSEIWTKNPDPESAEYLTAKAKLAKALAERMNLAKAMKQAEAALAEAKFS